MRPRGPISLALCLAALTLSACGSSPGSGTGTTTATHTGSTANVGPTQAGGGKLGPEGILIERGQSLGPASTTSKTGQVDGIKCAPIEQLAYHIHAHLQVFANGQPRQLPGAI